MFRILAVSGVLMGATGAGALALASFHDTSFGTPLLSTPQKETRGTANVERRTVAPDSTQMPQAEIAAPETPAPETPVPDLLEPPAAETASGAPAPAVSEPAAVARSAPLPKAAPKETVSSRSFEVFSLDELQQEQIERFEPRNAMSQESAAVPVPTYLIGVYR